MDRSEPGDQARLLLARMTTKTSAMEPAIGSGRTGLTIQSMVAGAVSGIRRQGPKGQWLPDLSKQRLLLYLWAGHTSERDRDRLLSSLICEAAGLWPDVWRPVEPGSMRKLLTLIIDEKMNPTICRGCSGKGQVLYRGEWVIHGPCRGLGKYPWGTRRLAELYQVSRKTWKKKYRSRHQFLMNLVNDLESGALRDLREQL